MWKKKINKNGEKRIEEKISSKFSVFAKLKSLSLSQKIFWGVVAFVVVFAFVGGGYLLANSFLNNKNPVEKTASATDYINLSTISAQDGGFSSFETTVQDYVYFPSLNDDYYTELPSNGHHMCAPTDWCLANYALKQTLYTAPYTSTPGTTHCWLRSAYAQGYVYNVGINGALVSQNSPNYENRASRCVCNLNLSNTITALKASNASVGTINIGSIIYHTITLNSLMYPQTIVSDSATKTALNSLSSSAKTGKKYVGRTTVNSSGVYSTTLVEEYKYNNEFYVKVPQFGYDTSYYYSDGTTQVANTGTRSYVWIKVEPIVWVIYPASWRSYETNLTNQTNASGNLKVFSLYAIVSGMYFYPNTSDNYRTSWTSSCWRAYLNGYNLKKKSDSYMATIKANFNDNYSFLNTIYHEIIKTSVAKPTLTTSSFTYTGSAINLISKSAISGYDSTTMNISGHEQTNVGSSYTVTFSLKNTNTHQWSDGTTTDVSRTWAITQATNSWTTNPSMAGWTYGNTASTPAGTPKFGSVVRSYKLSSAADSTYTTTIPSNAGTYTMKSYVAGTTNYTGLTNTSVTFTISKANISPSVTMSGYTYAGTKQEPSISGNTGSGAVTYYYNTTNSNSGGTAWSNVTSSTSLNAATYYMYAVVGETTNYNGATTSAVSFTISKASNPISTNNPSTVYVLSTTNLSSYVSNAQGTVSYAIATDGAATSSLSGSSLTVGSLSTSNDNNGTVTVTVTAAGNTNYNSGSSTITVTVQKYTATASWTYNPTGKSIAYGESGSATASVTASGGTVGTKTYSSNNTNVFTINSSSGAITPVAAGSSATAKVSWARTATVKAGNANSESITITRAVITAPTQSGTLTFNKADQTVSWTGYDTNKMTLDTSTSTTTAKKAGTYYAYFTPTANYQWSTTQTNDTTGALQVAWTINPFSIEGATIVIAGS